MLHVRHPRRPAIGVWAIAALLALLVAACGDDEGAAGPAASDETSATTPGLEEARKNVEAHSKPPTEIGPTTPIDKPVPEGKVIAYVDCGAPACTNQGNGLKEAAAVLGWTVKVVQAQPTPAAVQEAMDEVIRLQPDGVASAGLSKTQYPRQFEKLVEMGIPIVTSTNLERTGEGGTTLNIQDADKVIEATSLLADKTVVDLGGKGTVGVVYLTGFPLPKLYTDGYVKRVEEVCPDCKIETIEIQPTAIGKDAPQKIANWLRSKPDVKHVFFGYDALALGLPAAVKGAGLEVPKTYAYSPDQPGVEALKTGERTAAVPQPYHEIGWQWADGFLRVFTGGDVKDTGSVPDWVIWSEDFDNLPDETNAPVIIPDYQEQYKQLWGVN